MRNKESRPMASSDSHFVYSQLIRKTLAMIAQRVGRRSIYSADDVRIVPKSKNPGIWKIPGQQIQGPESFGLLVRPGCLPISAQSVDENNTMFYSAIHQ